MFRAELKRCLRRKSFMVILIFGIIINIIAIPKGGRYEDIFNDYLKSYVTTSYDNFIFFNLNPISNTLILMMPLIVAINYADSYIEDTKSGMIKNILTRTKKKWYLATKFLCNFIVSGISFSLPLLINILILMIKFPSIDTHPILGRQTILDGALLPELYYKSPLVYIFLWIFIYFCYAGALASIALAVSSFIKNKFVAIGSPFIITILTSIIFTYLDISRWSPLSFLYLSIEQNLMIIVLEFIIIVVTSFLVFYIRGNQNELY